MCWRVKMLVWVLAGFLIGAFSGGAYAGTYYTYQDDPAYWWYAQENPSFWLLVPSDAVSYRDVEMFGVEGVDLVLREGGPQLQVRRIQSTDVERIWNAQKDAWAHALRNTRVTTNRTITTSNGVRAHFRVLEGTGVNGVPAMIRFVAFVEGDYTVYLTFLGSRASYSGRAQQVWLRAVNTFSWR